MREQSLLEISGTKVPDAASYYQGRDPRLSLLLCAATGRRWGTGTAQAAGMDWAFTAIWENVGFAEQFQWKLTTECVYTENGDS